MKCSLVWDFRITRLRGKHEFRPKFYDTKFNYHFVASILKSNNLIAQIQDFTQYKYIIAIYQRLLLYRKTERQKSFVDKSCNILYMMAVSSFIFQQFWLVTFNKRTLKSDCLFNLFLCPFIGLEKDVIWSKKIVQLVDKPYCSDSKDHQWFQTGCNKS